MSEAEEVSGLEMMQQNMAAVEAGEAMPHSGGDKLQVVDDIEDVVQEPVQETEFEHEVNAETIKTEDLGIEEQVDTELGASEEDIADKDGWESKEDWIARGMDEDDYLTREEFTAVGEIRDDKNITRQTLAKQNVKTNKIMKEMQANMLRIIEDNRVNAQKDAQKQHSQDRVQYDNEIAALQAKLQEATDYGNTEDALKVQQEMMTKPRPQEPQPVQQQLPPNVQAWGDSNAHWYGKHEGATQLLDIHMERLVNLKDGRQFEDLIQEAEGFVDTAYPGYILKPKAPEKPVREIKARPTNTSESSTTPKKKVEKKYSYSDLPEEQRVFARQMAKATNTSESDYVKSIKESL